MTASASTSPPPPAPPAGSRLHTPPPDPIGQQPATGQSGTSTPGFLRRWNVILPVLIASTGLIGVVGSFLVQDAARSTTDSTAPSLIEVQDLFASVAEANAAATAAHLSVDATGVEDRASRNLYVDALRRANQQLGQVSADLGRAEEAGAELQDIGASLSVYSGEVEAARVAKANGLPTADERLRNALGVVDSEIAPAVATLTGFGQSRYDNEADQGGWLVLAALALGLITLAAMVWMQVQLAKRTRRILNPLLVLSTLAVVAIVALLGRGYTVRLLALDDARSGGYEAVTATAEMQSATFAIQSDLGLALLDDSGQRAERLAAIDDALAAAESSIAVIDGGADSDREQAAATALAVRWQRYRDVVDDVVVQARSGNVAAAVVTLQGDGLSAFNGVNTAIESVLSDNRSQFSNGVETAETAVDLNPWLCLLLTVAAGLLAIVAIQRRLGEY